MGLDCNYKVKSYILIISMQVKNDQPSTNDKLTLLDYQ